MTMTREFLRWWLLTKCAHPKKVKVEALLENVKTHPKSFQNFIEHLRDESFTEEVEATDAGVEVPEEPCSFLTAKGVRVIVSL